MYESDKRFSIRGVIVTILLIILIVCVLIWLFSAKKTSKSDITYSEKFNTNIKILENAGRSYYYRATLPTKVNASKKVNLKTLIKDNKLAPLYDKDGKSCDDTTSYVELTKKNEKEFDLKSHLKCGKEENEIVSTFNCSETKSKCVVTKITKKSTSKKENTKSNTESNNKTSNVSSNVTYRYLYSCTDKYRIYSDWSDWTTTFSKSDVLREVQTKTVTTKEYVKTGTKKEPTTTYVKKKEKETTIEEQKWVNTKPDNAKSCYSIPKSNYTIYVCQVEVVKEVEKEVPVTTYKTVDVYGYKDVVTTYYRTRTFTDKVNSYTYWDTNPNNEGLLNAGCTITKSEKVSY